MPSVSLWERLKMSTAAAVDAWQLSAYPTATIADVYDFRWQAYSGELFAAARQRNPILKDPRVYANTSYLWSHVESVVEFYASVIYQGDLSTDGEPLEDGTKGAIPIDAQAGSEDANTALREALSELWGGWNWRQQMSYRPLYGAALGDVLTELIDNVPGGFVYPQIIWPGYVTDVELDSVDNVKAYTLEYTVTEDTTGETFRYKKEVDGEAIRHYKNDKEWGDTSEGGHGEAVQPNPYGFVPAVWDRHRIGKPDSVRGRSATEGTIQALLQMNSFFSFAFDYQQKAFWQPVVIKGKFGSAVKNGKINLGAPVADADDRTAIAKRFDALRASPDSDIDIKQVPVDIGQTLAMLEFVKAGVMDAAPEASFYQKLREMQNVTAPGAHQLQGDVTQRVNRARQGYDTQSRKLFQMAIAMIGMRVNAGDYGDGLTRRQEAFRPFGLDSFASGLLDFGIMKRELVAPTEEERIALVAAKESLQSRWAMESIGMDVKDIDRILTDRTERYAAALNRGAFGTDYQG